MTRTGSIPDTEECILSLKHVKPRAVYYSVEDMHLYLGGGYLVRISVRISAVMRIFLVFRSLTGRLF
jgi:hypothetical protein